MGELRMLCSVGWVDRLLVQSVSWTKILPYILPLFLDLNFMLRDE